MGMNGRNEVRTDIKREYIVGSPDMNRIAILAEAKEGTSSPPDDPGHPADVRRREQADHRTATGRPKCFASYMRIHTFEATGGKTYSQMGRFLTKGGKDTNDAAAAAKDPKTGQPVENGARNIWVTATALTNALNTSFFAEQVAMFGIVVGIALLLVGIGLAILAFMAFRWFPARQAAGPRAAKASIGATPKAT